MTQCQAKPGMPLGAPDCTQEATHEMRWTYERRADAWLPVCSGHATEARTIGCRPTRKIRSIRSPGLETAMRDARRAIAKATGG